MKNVKPAVVILLVAAAVFMAACTARSEAADAPAKTETVPTAVPPTSTPSPSPTAIPATRTSRPKPEIEIDLAMEIGEGDPKLGLNRALSNGCRKCHAPVKEEYENHGPPFAAGDDLPAILERGELRMADPAYEGSATTNMEYIIESIFLPEDYIVAGDWKETMPTYFHTRLTDEDLADIVAWMRTFE